MNVLEILRDKGHRVEERDIYINEIVEAYNKGELNEAFGVGTAAVVSHISEIAHEDLKMSLPSMDNRPVAKMIYEQIEGLRSGEVVDTKGWMVPVL